MFRLAKELGCFVSDIEERMSLGEMVEWAAFFELEFEANKKAMAEAKKNAKKGK